MSIMAGTPLLKDPVLGGLEVRSVGPIAFSPCGSLILAEPATGSVLVVETVDFAPGKLPRKPVEHVQAVLAGATGVATNHLEIVDLKVHPASRAPYFTVRDQTTKAGYVVRIDETGAASVVDLSGQPHHRVKLPESATGNPVRTITDVGFATDRLLVSGQCSEEFSSKIYSIPVPITVESSAGVFSAETYHVAHGRWETKAPITKFTPFRENNRLYLVGAFACTPIAKFPLNDLESGAHVKGVSVVELGSGNRPIDVFTYRRDDTRWLVANTMRFKENLFGPSKYWGVRVHEKFLTADDPAEVNENAPRRDVKAKAGPDGVEILDDLFGAVQVARVDNERMLVLRETGDSLRLEVCPLP
jgi:hypothetical protein